MIEVRKLGEDCWEEYRDLRFDALNSEPRAFGSSYEEELQLSEEQWRERIKNTIFALDDDKLIGMLVSVVERNQKMKHIANIFGVYVKQEYRHQHIGTKLFQYTIAQLQENKAIVKIRLAVNNIQKNAIKLYKKMGFKVVGHLKKELQVDGNFYDEPMMEKFL